MLTPDDTFVLRGAEGEEIAGDVFLPKHDGRAPLIIVVHGFKGFKHWGFIPHIARTLADAGFCAAAVSLSHCGVQGPGDVFNRLDLFERDTWGKRLYDLKQVIDAGQLGLLTDKQPIDGARIGVVGHSAGGGLGLLCAAKDPRVKALATIGAIMQCNRFPPQQVEPQLAAWGYMKLENARTKQEMHVGRAFFDELQQHPQAFSIEAAARALTRPWLLVHGVDDEAVPFDEALQLLDWANENAVAGANVKLLSLENTGHTLGTEHPFRRRTAECEQALAAIIEHFRRAFAA